MRQIESTSELFHPHGITFRRHDGTGAREVFFEDPNHLKILGSGYFGTVYEAKMTLPSEIAKDEEKSLVALKFYKSLKDLQRARERYWMARSAGLDVPVMFRYNEVLKVVVLTPGHRADSLYISAKPQSDEAHKLTEEPLEMSDELIQEMARQVFKQARQAYNADIILPGDAYLFQLKHTPERQLTHVYVEVGDFDNLQNNQDPDPDPETGRKPKTMTPDQLKRKNLNTARLVIDVFLAHYQTRKITEAEVESAIRRAQHNP